MKRVYAANGETYGEEMIDRPCTTLLCLVYRKLFLWVYYSMLDVQSSLAQLTSPHTAHLRWPVWLLYKLATSVTNNFLLSDTPPVTARHPWSQQPVTDETEHVFVRLTKVIWKHACKTIVIQLWRHHSIRYALWKPWLSRQATEADKGCESEELQNVELHTGKSYWLVCQYLEWIVSWCYC